MTSEETIAELRAAAQRTLEPNVFGYFDGGSGDGISRDEAVAAWRTVRFRPRVLRDVSTVDTRARVLGTELAAPLVVSPMASLGLLHADGERAVARAAADLGVLMICSTRSSTPVEDIAATGCAWWLQAYITRERTAIDGLARRAADSGAGAIVLTGDTPYLARRPFGRPQALDRPASLVNLGRHLPPGCDPRSALEQDPAAVLDDIARLRAVSGLPVLVKGVLRADDARACLAAGAAGVVVSNHGGRQLDRAVASRHVLPEVVAASPAAPVLVDGGIRGGLDLWAASALGAGAVGIGRPVAWALAAGGAERVRELLAGLIDEFAHVMALTGARSVAELGSDLIVG